MEKRYFGSRDIVIGLIPIFLIILSYTLITKMSIFILPLPLAIISIIFAVYFSYSSFIKGLMMHKYSQKWHRRFGLLISVFFYVYLMVFTSIFFSQLFIAGSSFDSNKIIDVTTSTAVNPNSARALVFSMVTLTTIGYGNIIPVGLGFEIIAALEGLMGMAINVIFVSIAIAEIIRK